MTTELEHSSDKFITVITIGPDAYYLWSQP